MNKHLLGIATVCFLPICFAIEAYGQKNSEATLAANKAVVRRYFEEIINQRKLELLREVFAPDFHSVSLEDGTQTGDIEGLESFIPQLLKAIPDIHYTVDQLVVEGDKVVIQLTARGTHKETFFGHPASNNQIKISEVFFFTLKNSKITESRVLIDMYNLHKQLSGEK